MADIPTFPTIHWPEGFDARSEFETPMRGYLSDVTVQAEDGTSYSLFFIDPSRLRQELEYEVKSGSPFFAEPGMIVLPQVTTDAICAAVAKLWQQGYFGNLKPVVAGNEHVGV